MSAPLCVALFLLGGVSQAAPPGDLTFRSETLLRMEDANTTGLESFSLPSYELLDLHARNLGGTGLSVEGSGWGRLGLGEQTLPERDRADLSEGLVRYDAPQGNVRVGRQFVSAGPLAEPLDGGGADLRLPREFGLSLYGGAPVLDSNGRIYGGRLGWSHGLDGSIGAGAFVSRVGSESDRERIGLDGVLRPGRSVELGAYGYYELLLRRLVSTRATVGVRPWTPLFLSAEYDASDPAALLGATSIFSTFTNERYQSGTLRAEYTIPVLEIIPTELTPYEVIDRIVLVPEGRRLWFEGGASGWRFGGEVRTYFVEDPRSFCTIGVWRQMEPERGYTETRAAASYYVLASLYAMAEGILDAYDAPLRGQDRGLTLGGGAGYELSEALRLQGSGEWITSPLVEKETRGMLKVLWSSR